MKKLTRAILVAGTGIIAAMGGTDDAEAGKSISGLPYAEGRTFATLDDYLAHLKERSTIGVPHYVEVAPGVFVRQGQVAPRGEKPARMTREELRRQFGFDR
jgi:hypothetical protein